LGDLLLHSVGHEKKEFIFGGKAEIVIFFR